MDSVSLSISLALISGVASGLTETGKDAISDTYKALKKKLSEKFGKSSNIPKAINLLEESPDSKIIKDSLAKEIERVEANKDSEILKIAGLLIELLSKEKYASSNTQIINGNYNAVSSGGGIASVNVNIPKK